MDVEWLVTMKPSFTNEWLAISAKEAAPGLDFLEYFML